MPRWQRTSALILFALAVASCNPSPRIKDILERPTEFEGKAVAVSGTVVEAANVLVLRFYKVDDGTGKIVVVTKKAVPAKGPSVTPAASCTRPSRSATKTSPSSWSPTTDGSRRTERPRRS